MKSMIGSSKADGMGRSDSFGSQQERATACVSLQVLLFHCLLALLGVLSVAVLDAIVDTNVAFAQAQPVSISSLPADGFWSFAAGSASAPHLAINLDQLNAFATTNLVRARKNRQDDGIIAELPPSAIDTLQIPIVAAEMHLGTAPLLPSQIAPPPTSLIRLVGARNASETSIEETCSPVDVNGLLVYPLTQINYGSWHLPVAMYVSTVRDSNEW